MMSAGDFDEHIAGVISEDYSKFNKCYDRIKSIMDMNARTDVCCFVFTTDVALPPMINLVATNLYVSANSSHWKL